MYFILGIIALLFVMYLARPKPDVTGEEAQKLVKAGAKLIDVRTTGEFAGGHLKGARNIPLHELQSRVEEIGDRAATIVLCCQSGMRSGRAKKMLRAAGYENVRDLGSIARW
jgi:rhodanese-related sulfurtransferase